MNPNDLAYHFGVFMGDGYIERYKADSSCWYVGLKSIDLDFVEYWRDVLERLTGRKYAIRQEKRASDRHNVRHRCRSGMGDFAKMTMESTYIKQKIPDMIINGTLDQKKQFIQGLMDSEGWISFILKSIGSSHLSLSFGVSSNWCFVVHSLFKECGIETTKVWTRKFSENPDRNGKLRKDFHMFEIDISDYINSGLGFNIKRKQDRLDYCSRILTDYTRDYPRYGDYLENSVGIRYSRPIIER